MGSGTIENEVEAPAVVRGDVWGGRVSEPHLSFGTHGLAGGAYPGLLDNLGTSGQQTRPGAC